MESMRNVIIDINSRKSFNMAGIKCKHCSKVCDTTRGMTKHLSTCKVRQGMAGPTVPCDILYKTNGFLIAKAEAMLPLIEPISKKESPYTDALHKRDPAVDWRDPAGIDKAAKMLGRSEDTEMPDVRHIPPESKHTTSSRSRSRIQSIQSGFKSIKFNDGKRGQAGDSVDEENTMAYMADIPIEQDNNCFPFKNNVEYAWAKFMQTSKMSKGSMDMFFNNSELALMRQHLSYKNVDKMRALLTELLYDKVTWWTKSLSICSVIPDVALKEYFMYYLDIIPAIRFLIGHCPFAPHMAYAPV